MTLPAQGTVLVTGATGTVGSAVVSELLASGITVRAGVRDPNLGEHNGADAVRFDFTDPGTWPAAMTGVDRLFLIRPPALSDVKRYLRPVIALAAQRGLRQVVFLSVMGVNRFLPHWQVERDLQASGLPHTFLRPAFFAQNLITAYRRDILEHDRIRLAARSGRTSFIDTRDVAAVAALALRDPHAHAGHAYTLTGPAALDWDQIAALLANQLARPITYQRVGLLRYRRELLAQGLDRSYVNVQLVINAVAALGKASAVTGEVRSLLSREPIPMQQFIADHAKAWQRQPM